jgi:hypothetical protein
MTTPELRRATESDLRFVRASWFASHWDTWAKKRIARSVYEEGQRERIRGHLERALTIVAFFPEVPDEVLGWACMEGDVLHYVYVKGSYRRVGICAGLVRGRAVWYTHPSDTDGARAMKHCNVQFNPYRERRQP